MEEIAKKKDVYLIAGHSHRPHLVEDELYINAGSCVHPWGITVLEIEAMHMNLVKWYMGTKAEGMLCVERKVLKGNIPIK